MDGVNEFYLEVGGLIKMFSRFVGLGILDFEFNSVSGSFFPSLFYPSSNEIVNLQWRLLLND